MEGYAASDREKQRNTASKHDFVKVCTTEHSFRGHVKSAIAFATVQIVSLSCECLDRDVIVLTRQMKQSTAEGVMQLPAKLLPYCLISLIYSLQPQAFCLVHGAMYMQARS